MPTPSNRPLPPPPCHPSTLALLPNGEIRSDTLTTQRPPGPKQLSESPKTTKSILGSPIIKNLAGLMIATGAGAAIGCPWVVALLIGTGLATSWIGGAGIVIGAIGIALWVLSTSVSAAESDPGDNLVEEIGFSVFMGVVGLPYVICTVIGNFFNRCCCGVGDDEETDHEVGASESEKQINKQRKEAESIYRANMEKFQLDLANHSKPSLPNLTPPPPLSQTPPPLLSQKEPPTTADKSEIHIP